MRRLAILAGAAGLLLAASAVRAGEQVELRQAPLTWRQAALSNGEALYMELCAVCHGVDAKGNGPANPALATPATDLTSLGLHHQGAFPFQEVERVISGDVELRAHGTREMPMWGQALREVRPDVKSSHRHGLAELKVYNLTSYLETLQVSE